LTTIRLVTSSGSLLFDFEGLKPGRSRHDRSKKQIWLSPFHPLIPNMGSETIVTIIDNISKLSANSTRPITEILLGL